MVTFDLKNLMKQWRVIAGLDGSTWRPFKVDAAGALVTIDLDRTRVRILPIHRQ